MTLQEIQYKAQSIINKWRDDDSAPYIEFVEELAHMIVPEPSEDLEEAAEAFAFKSLDEVILYGCTLSGRRACFITGAKWQENKDQETIKLAEDHAFLAGADWQKEQMMKEAVEGLICATITGTNAISFLSPLPKELMAGDKVRVIIVKEDKK